MSASKTPGNVLSAAAAAAAICLLAISPVSVRAETRTPTPCSDLKDLRNLSGNLKQVTNARTGDSLNYIVVGDGATGTAIGAGHTVTDAEVIVLFPGTNGVLADWPVQMITNSTHSPKIKTASTYMSAQDGRISLCHDYYLVLFDYPGVGDTSFDGTLTGDRIANDVDAMLDDATATYAITTDTVNLAGWSLGTLYALKYAFLSPAASTGRTIGDLALIASKAGGNVDDVPSGNQASCITTLFDSLANEGLDDKLKSKIQLALIKLTFPFAGQSPYNGTDDDGCTAEIDYDTGTVTVSVDYDCPKGSECRNDIRLQLANRKISPWSETDGVPYDLYVQQRDFVADWDYCYCKSAGSDYASENCSCSDSYPAPTSDSNGGMCKTVSEKANAPASYKCAALDLDGAMTVINGPEDLVIQWKYGRELARAYNDKYGSGTANYVRFRGSSGAGHSIMAQHPKWMQKKIYKAIIATD